MTKHEHYKEIIAWANGAKIQRKDQSTPDWYDDINPRWLLDHVYRLKLHNIGIHRVVTHTGEGTISSINYQHKSVLFAFDGETNELISVEMIKNY